MKYNLGFGDSFLVRELILEETSGVVLQCFDADSFNYEAPNIEAAIIKKVKQITKDFLGYTPKHVGLSHGATGGIMAAIRALNPSEVKYAQYYFPYYPEMVSQSVKKGTGVAYLIDSPSNPKGDIVVGTENKDKTIFDAAYHSPIYMPKTMIPLYPAHKIMIGSFGKLFGLNGLRLGWFATDDSFLFESMSKSVINETLGLSVTNMTTLISIIDKVDHMAFTEKAGSMINDNRSELQKIERFFEGKVPETGMFYFPKADKAALDLLSKAKVQYIKGENCGSQEGHIRLSLGNTREITQDAVKELLKIDKL